MSGSSGLRATLIAIRQAPDLRARVEALEAENAQLRARIDEAISIATALRDDQRRRLVEEAETRTDQG